MAQQPSIRFFRDKKLMGFLSEQAGHPVYQDADFVEITIPGDMNNVIVREATEKDKNDYAATYGRYKEGLTPSVDGTPLEAWPRLTPAAVANYKAMGVHTVEQISEMSDQVCNKVSMGAMADRTAALAYIKLAKDSALAQKQALELERQNQIISDLKRQVEELAALADKPKRGRPVKEEAEA